jgi:hypothetical protein
MFRQHALFTDEFGAEFFLGWQDELVLCGEELFISVKD